MKEYEEKNNIPVVVTDSNSGKGIKDVIKMIQIVAKESKEKFAQKGRVGKKQRCYKAKTMDKSRRRNSANGYTTYGK